MDIGEIRNNNSKLPPLPEPTGKIFSEFLFCSTDESITRLLLKQTPGFMPIGGKQQHQYSYEVVGKKRVVLTQITVQDTASKPSPGPITGDASCLSCGQPMFANCRQCNRWYCASTKEEAKDGTWHTCPIHGRGKISGTLVPSPDNDPKKKNS
jgi:hypothetical protein